MSIKIIVIINARLLKHQGTVFILFCREDGNVVTVLSSLREDLDLKSTVVKGTRLGWGVCRDTFHQEDSQAINERISNVPLEITSCLKKEIKLNIDAHLTEMDC